MQAQTFWRRVALVFAAWLLGLGAVALYLNHYDWNRARPYIARYSKKYLGREISVHGDLALHLGMHPVLVANNLTYENAAWAGKEPAFRAGRLEVRVDLWPAFRDVLQVAYVRLHDAHLLVVTGADGSSSLMPEKASDGKESEDKSTPIDWRLLGVDLVNVTVDYSGATPIHAVIAHLASAQVGIDAVKMEGIARINGVPADLVATATDYQAALTGNKPLRLDAKAHFGQLTGTIAGGIRDLKGFDGLAMDATVIGKNAQDVAHAFGLVLNDDIEDIKLSAHLEQDAKVWTFDRIAAEVGPSTAHGKVSLALGDPWKLTATVRSPYFRFRDLGAFLPKTVAEELPAAKQAKSRATGAAVRLFSNAPFPVAVIKNLDLDIDFAVERFVGLDKAAMVDALQGHLLAKGGKLELRPLKLTMAGGQFATDFEFDTTQDPPRAYLVANVSQVEVGRFMAPYLETDNLKESHIGKLKTSELFAGRLNGRIDLRGSGQSVREIMADLSGDAGLALENGKMSSLIIEALGMDATEAVGVLVAKKQTVPMDCLIASLEVKAGQVSPRVILASTNDSDVVVSGKMDLRAETLEALIRTLPKDFSVGSLRTPIKISGPFYKIHVDVVRPELAGRIAAAVALGVLLSPVAALLPLIEPGLQADGACKRYIGEIQRIRQGNATETH